MKRYFLYGLLLLATYLYGIHYLPLRGEEANRILTAYEMVHFGDFFNLTHLGEPYYAKPPLFMYIVALFSSLFGWAQESARLISVFSSFLTAFITYLFYKKLFGELKGSFTSAILLLTFGDLALFYGFVAEIDAFHMFAYFLSVFLLFETLRRGKTAFAFSLAGIFTAILFLTKGFPAFYHIPLSFLILLVYFGRLREILSPKVFLPFLSFAPIVGFWFLNLKEPKIYLHHLWSESFSRTPIAEKSNFLKHLLLYPLLNLKQLLPNSLFLVRLRSFGNFDRNTLFILSLFFLNYLPYLVSPGARGRYIVILFPFLAIFIAKLVSDIVEKELQGKIFKTLALFEVVLLLIGFILIFTNRGFFEKYNLTFAFVFLLILLFSTFVFFKHQKNLLFGVSLTVALLKFGYINYYAPFKERKHPEREIASVFAKYIPKGSKIKYLPKKVDMELCAYLDIYTKGIVLRKTGTYFVTTKKELPKGKFKILKIYRGWILGKFEQT